MTTFSLKKAANLAILLASIVIVGGCSLPAKRKAFSPGTVFISKTRDAEQNGRFIEESSESGKYFDEVLAKKLNESGAGFEAIRSTSSSTTHQSNISKEKAIELARQKGADYCFKAEFGEFLDAAPMTFRSDSLVLREAALYDVQEGEYVWKLTQGVKRELGNLPPYTVLVRNLAHEVANDIIKSSRK